MTTLSALENQVTEAVERLSESVVSIDSVRVTRDFRYGLVPIEGKGSGLIIDRKGYVITNNHVIDGATRVQVHLKDGRTFFGEVVGLDSSTDIAVIKVDADNLPAASLGDSEKLKVGQIALAIGVNTMKWVVQQILEKGRVIRPWLGISGANMNQAIARRYDLPADSGVLVVEVDSRGPAYEAGMRVGDVIKQIGSHAVKQMKDILMALSKLAIKEEVEVGFIRLNAKRKALLRLKESPIAVSASREG